MGEWMNEWIDRRMSACNSEIKYKYFCYLLIWLFICLSNFLFIDYLFINWLVVLIALFIFNHPFIDVKVFMLEKELVWLTFRCLHCYVINLSVYLLTYFLFIHPYFDLFVAIFLVTWCTFPTIYSFTYCYFLFIFFN